MENYLFWSTENPQIHSSVLFFDSETKFLKILLLFPSRTTYALYLLSFSGVELQMKLYWSFQIGNFSSCDFLKLLLKSNHVIFSSLLSYAVLMGAFLEEFLYCCIWKGINTSWMLQIFPFCVSWEFC